MAEKHLELPIRKQREYSNWWTVPPTRPYGEATSYQEPATVGLLEETLRRHAEIPRVGRDRFQGSLKQRNALWYEFRNYMRQAMGNFNASMGIGGRSATLLQYYSLLNFAKAELLDTHASDLIDKKIGHGLSFSPTRARSVAGDFLTVHKGVFPLIYERRTGTKLPVGTKLPIARLLANIPEISGQLEDSGVTLSNVAPVSQLFAFSDDECWCVLAVGPSPNPLMHTSTRQLILRHFDLVHGLDNWRQSWGWSPRDFRRPIFLESKLKIRRSTPHAVPSGQLQAISWELRDVLSHSGREAGHDADVTPYLFKTSTLPMPASLARYAVSYFASSLVRYKPSMFDANAHPEQASLFDAIARESAIPMLIDTLCGIEGKENYFFQRDAFRL